MARTLEETNKIVDRLATVAAILSVGQRIEDLIWLTVSPKEAIPPHPSDRDLVQSADELIDAAARYLEERDQRERRDVGVD